MKKVIAFLADKFETVEALAVIDLLRRAKVDVKTVSVMESLEVVSAQKIKVMADCMPDEVTIEDADMIFLPGGGGYALLAANEMVTDYVKQFAKEGKYLAAICAAPSILGNLGLLEGKNATCFPGFEDKLIGANVSDAGVVCDGNIITGKGMGVSVEFGLKIIEKLIDKETADSLSASIQFGA